MLTVPQKAAEVQRASEQLLRQARSALDSTDQFFQDEGLDPAKVRGAFASLSTPEVESEAQAQLEQFNHVLAREMTQKRAELGLPPEGRSASGGVKRHRPMV